ncbi:solute carrier organic anion transporter family member 1C1-like [Odontesthes bonariensis]|uniref:solute carrier organic anion transporter family member 1C1-like n=1 Tax=Odontesthes bonariensis TaxID=219752 RepID=UPI003F58B347
MSVESKKTHEAGGSKLKLFLVSLAFVYFAKAFCGAYLKSSITQIERRFDIPSSLIGVIDGSFEMGNLLVIAFVSYFGAKLHRPRLIGIGCLIMATGSFLIATPHFFQGPYKYETSMSHGSQANSTGNIQPCQSNHSVDDGEETYDAATQKDCERAAGSSMWIYVFLGNVLRGIGETPIMPLGVSYLDDFSREENTPFYLAGIHTAGILGPMVGFMLGSFLAKIYVDVGFVDLESITITHKDSRWVGAWWLGFIVTGMVILLSSIPFFFLPKSLPKQGKEKSGSKGTELTTMTEQENFLPEETHNHEEEKTVTVGEMVKDFIPSLRRLFKNSIYSMMILTYLVAVNGFIGIITFKPKFMEQIYGQSASKAIFLIGIVNLPAVALGIITGGFVLKRFKLGIVGAARLSIAASLGYFCLLSIQVFLHCDNAEVAGLTVSYQGAPHISYNPQTLLTQCNSGCSCSMKPWDPVCGYNGVTYASPCLAGCQTSSGAGRAMVFHNCTCIGEAMTPALTNMSAELGQCQRSSNCDYKFKIYMIISVICSFISGCGGTPGYIVLLRSIQPDLKSLALGMQTLIVRTLGGIPPPIYFGALIDRTCLKWGTKQCGGRGACRLYDANAFRVTFLGLITGLYFLATMMWGGLYYKIVKRQKKLALRNQAKENGLDGNGVSNGHASISIAKNKEDTNKESTI